MSAKEEDRGWGETMSNSCNGMLQKTNLHHVTSSPSWQTADVDCHSQAKRGSATPAGFAT